MQHINSTNEKGTCFADQLKRGVHIGVDQFPQVAFSRLLLLIVF